MSSANSNPESAEYTEHGEARHSVPSSSGVFLSLEGVDGVGKSTQCTLLCDALALAGRTVMRLREPGGTKLGEGIRALLLDRDALDDGVTMSPACEVLLYEAARAQLVAQVIGPALQRGDVVVCDRFCDSTVAYQGHARGLGIDSVASLNALACSGILPDRTIVLDMDPHEALARTAARDQAPDRLESEGVEFQVKVREGFRACALSDPARVRIVDASGEVGAVYSRIRDELADVVCLPTYAEIASSRKHAESGVSNSSVPTGTSAAVRG